MEVFSLGQCFTRITEDQSELQQEILFWVCPQPSTFLLIFSAHRMILSWLGCSIPPGQKPLVPKSWSAPITSNPFFLLHYVVHTCGLLISCLQIPTHRAGRYYRECVSMAHLASSSYPQSISPWTSHTETHLTAFIHSHPLSQSASPYPWGYHLCCRSLLSTEGYNDTVWKMDLVQKIKSILSSSAEGVVSLQVSPLNLSTKFTQFSYFQLRRANLFS